jgi:hypothetical protein
MGILDELREQADQRRGDEQERAERESERSAYYRNELLPRMRVIYAYLFELVQHVNYLQPEVCLAYQFEGLGRLEGFCQGPYQLTTEGGGNLKRVTLSCEAVRDKTFEHETTTRQELERMKNYFWRNRLPFQANAAGAERGVRFIFEGRVPVVCAFEVDFATGAIVLTMRNVDRLGMDRFSFKPEQVDEVLLDRFARFVLRRDDGLIALEMSEEDRDRLRRMLHEQKRQTVLDWVSWLRRAPGRADGGKKGQRRQEDDDPDESKE